MVPFLQWLLLSLVGDIAEDRKGSNRRWSVAFPWRRGDLAMAGRRL